VLKTRIIPILLLQGSVVVKTVKFKEPRIVGDAITNVKVFSNRMADEMIIVDIEATKKGFINEDLIRRLASSCVMPLSVGGGIKNVEDADKLFRSGADKIVINSSFYSNPDLLTQIANKYGNQAVVFSLDVKKNNGRYYAASHSGSKLQDIDVLDVAQTAIQAGAGEIILNSIDFDGTMNGYDTELINIVSNSVDVPVISAGGCGSKEDCVAAVKHGASAVAAGSIFYWVGESIITVKRYMKDNEISVRII
jgi:cyclase